jgi:membrane protein implicated in regulation of membrane protease activity
MNPVINGLIWLAVAVALCIVEAATVQLVCIWFAGGAFVAMGAAFLGAPLWAQLALFVVTSVAVLIAGRPFLKARLTPRKTPTNADAAIGGVAVVTQPIDNSRAEGRATISGLDWAARTQTPGLTVPAGEKVRVLAIDGVKLIVEPLQE